MRPEEPELLDEPELRAEPDLPELLELPLLVTVDGVPLDWVPLVCVPWLPPLCFMDGELVVEPEGRPSELRSMLRPGTRLPDPWELRRITRFPLSG